MFLVFLSRGWPGSFGNCMFAGSFADKKFETMFFTGFRIFGFAGSLPAVRQHEIPAGSSREFDNELHVTQQIQTNKQIINYK